MTGPTFEPELHGLEPLRIPWSLQWLEAKDEGRKWLSELPELLASCLSEWDLLVAGEAFEGGRASFTLPVILRQDGSAAVLKLQYPDRESLHEAAALGEYDGHGAVTLLAHDVDRRALLLERAIPGTPLSTLTPPAALAILAELLPRIWKPTSHDFSSLEKEANGWAASLLDNWRCCGEPFERDLVDASLAAISDLSASQGAQVLINQDLHGDNVLAAQREPWVCIDPKPLVGEREFALAPIIRSRELGHSREDVLHRLNWLTAKLNLDRERSRRWALAQTVAWSFENNHVLAPHVEVARWLYEAG